MEEKIKLSERLSLIEERLKELLKQKKPEEVQVGSVCFSSSSRSMENLVDLMDLTLKKKSVKDYIGGIEKTKLLSSIAPIYTD